VTNSTGTTADYYRILGINPEAGQEEIRAAYRARLRLWHPDLVADETQDGRRTATEMTAQLNEAHACLGDPDRRAAYDTSRRGRFEPAKRTPTPTAAPPPRRAQSTGRPGRRGRDMTTIGLGGIVVPLFGLTWVSGLLAVPAPANRALIAGLCAGMMAATIWLLTSSRLLRQPERLAPIGIVWSHLTRWSGWIVIGGCVLFLGIPAIALTLMIIVAAPFFGLVVVAFISGRPDSPSR